MRLTRTMASGAVALALLAAGCGSDSDEGGSGGGGGGSTVPEVTIPPAKDITLDKPVKIVAIISDPSNSSEGNAIPDFNDGIRMAVDEINAAGGIGGHQVEFSAIDTSPTAVDQATTSFNLALQQQPTVILGPISSTTALGLTQRIADAGIPVIANSVEPQLAKSQQGNDWLFVNRPLNDRSAAQTVQFAADELNAETVGVLATNTAFGRQGVEGFQEGASTAGVTIGAERTFDFNATDLTEPVVAMQDSDVVLDWGTPNTLALSVRTMAQQGMIDKPHIGPGSVGFPSFVTQVGDNSALVNTYGAVDCNPGDDQRDVTKSFVQKFEDRFKYVPSYAATEMYDAVMMVRNIVEEKGSAAPADIQAGLNTVDWDGGACAETYVNKDNFLVHQVVMAKFDDDGVLRTIRTYTDL
jgi:branched-chain amino acid transport system substrate-binding protein